MGERRNRKKAGVDDGVNAGWRETLMMRWWEANVLGVARVDEDEGEVEFAGDDDDDDDYRPYADGDELMPDEG